MGFRIETDRLVLREWAPGDLARFTEIATDPRVLRYVSDGVPWDEARIREFVERQRDQAARLGYCMGALALKEDGGVGGLAGLQPLGRSGEVEAGWWLAPHLWGRGLATEAGRALVEFAFGAAGLRRLVAVARPENRASTRVMEKLGMALERTATGRELGISEPDVDLVLYALDRPA